MDRKKLLKTLYWATFALILYYWLQSSLSLIISFDVSNVLLGFGRLFGLTSVFCVFTQLFLIGRIKWIEVVWGHDELAKIHRKVGRYVLYFILLHFTFILGSYALSAHTDVLTQLWTFFTQYNELLKAFGGFLLFVVIALLSIYMKRLKLKYETWYFIHLLVYVAILFAFDHQLLYGGTLSQPFFALFWQAMYVFVIGNFVFFRFLIPCFMFYKHRFFVKSVEVVGDVTIIIISGKNMESFKRKAGQFMIFRFLDKKRFWQAHPFSVSWGVSHENIRICVRNSGDFTSEITTLHVGTPVFIDGPHGHFIVDQKTKQKLLLIAGGIGITPILSLLEDNAQSRNVVFVYSNKVPSDVPLKHEIEKITSAYKIPSYFFFTEGKSKIKGVYNERVTGDILKKIVKDIKAREIYLCGPEGFMLGISQQLVSLGVLPENIHFELFSFQ